MRDRVYGIETEYAILFEPRQAHNTRPPALVLFGYVEDALKARFHTLPSHTRGKRGLFLENGGLVTFETVDGVEGLLEMSTPECRSARDVTVYQAALDVLAADLAAAVTARLRGGPHDGVVRFAKNCADGKGHTYGTHENYQVDDPSPALRGPDKLLYATTRGAWLASMGVLYVLTYALVGIALAVMLAAAICGFGVLGLVGLVEGTLRLVLRRWRRDDGFRAMSWTAGWLRLAGATLFEKLEVCLRVCSLHLLPMLVKPAARLYDRLLTRIALRPFVEGLAAYVATRPIWCGAGRMWVERGGRRATETASSQPFQISGRSTRVDRVSGAGMHPRYMFDLKNLILGKSQGVASRDKRLEIISGDSNMSEMCVYMKTGVTGLLLRMLEEGERFDELALADPVNAMHQVSADETLTLTLPMADGSRRTALDIQRAYLRRASAFYAAREADAESRQMLATWSRTLDALEHDPKSLAAQVDWIAKRVLMRTLVAAAGATLEEVEDVARIAADVTAHCGPVGKVASERVVRERLRRTMPRVQFEQARALVEYREMPWTRLVQLAHIAYQLRRLDLRYHELGESPSGHALLKASGAVRAVCSDEERSAALVSAPAGTRAERRSALVRQYARDAASRVSVTWEHFRGPVRSLDHSLGEPLS